MRVIFYGAAGSVTGSSYLLESEEGSILIDCGMFQGSKSLLRRNYLAFDYDPREIKAVIITHAHIDHSGLVPKLVKQGYRGPVYTARPTLDLLNILLYDSAHIEEMGIEIANKNRKRQGLPLKEPLLTKEDVDKTLLLVQEYDYHREFQVLPNIVANFKDAGHILGSAFLELKITENNITKKIVFSGDIGRSFQSFIRDPEVSEDADVVFMESTYGNRVHKKWADTEKELVAALEDISHSGGTLLIPAFAVGRTQEMIYKFFELYERHKIPPVPIYIDSPMGSKVTAVYEENKDLYDAKTIEYLNNGKNPIDLKLLRFIISAKESMQLNSMSGPKVIISSSGMCHGGRIMHHLKHNIWKKTTRILFVGYQGKGTLGRRIIEGAREVKILGRQVAVNAKVYTIGGLSAHADKDELLAWLKFYQQSNPLVFTVHGEPEVCVQFANTIQQTLGLKTFIPGWKDGLDFVFTEAEINVKHSPSLVQTDFEALRADYHSKINMIDQAMQEIEKDKSTQKKEDAQLFLKKVNRLLKEALQEYQTGI